MNATRALAALMACLAIGTSHAQQREYIIYDGQNYPGDQLDVAAASPVMVKPAQRLGNGDYSIPRAYFRAARLTSNGERRTGFASRLLARYLDD